MVQNSHISPSTSRKTKQDTSDPVQLTCSLHVLQNTQTTIAEVCLERLCGAISRWTTLFSYSGKRMKFQALPKQPGGPEWNRNQLYLHMWPKHATAEALVCLGDQTYRSWTCAINFCFMCFILKMNECIPWSLWWQCNLVRGPQQIFTCVGWHLHEVNLSSHHHLLSHCPRFTNN